MKSFCLAFFAMTLFFACTKDTGTVEITYQEATAIYGNLDDVRAMPLNENVQAISNPGKIFIGEGIILIGEEGEGIHVIDNSNRNNPIQTSFIRVPGNREFFVEGNTIYAESYYDMVKIDITNPNQAVLLDRAEFAIQSEFVDNNGGTLLGFSYEEKTVKLDQDDDFYQEVLDDQLVYLDFARNIIPQSAIPSSFAGNSAAQSGTVNRVNKSGDHIFVVSNNNLIVLNDNAFSTQFVINENVKEDMETVFPYEDKLFVGTRTSMTVFSIASNPENPQQVEEFDHATSCDPVLPHQDVAYVTLRTADFSDCPGSINALVVVDMDDISNTTPEQEITMTSPYGMTIINDQLYVGEGTSGLKIFDVNNTKNPQLVKTITDVEAYDIIADPTDSEIIFIAGPNGLTQFGIDNDLNFDFKSNIEL